MLTPRFEITQSETDVTITIHAPYANIKDTEVYVDGTDFRFYSTPYYLRLKLPGEIEENDASAGSYNSDNGDFVLTFSKVTKGEHFNNLDMITTLLAPPKKKSNFVPNIEVIGNPSADSKDIEQSSNETIAQQSEDEGDTWFIEQKILTNNTLFLSDSSKYGFANKISGALGAFEEAWIKEIIDLPSPDTIPQSERKRLREAQECKDFNDEHYMADLMQTEAVEPYLSYVADWQSLKKEDIILNNEEIDLLKELPNKEYLLNSNDIHRLLLSLVDILFGSCYNERTTLGENTVESSWTINKLSSTLCWFQDFNTMDEVITACFRRSLCYPLFRNWDLSMKVFEDVKEVLKLGKKYVIKRFCEIHSLFNNSYEPRYLLNQLYIKDYLIWLQQIPETSIESLIPSLDGIHPTKENMGLELVELEEAAYSVQEDLVIENTIHKVVDQMEDLNISDKGNEKLNNSFCIRNKQFYRYLVHSNSSSTDSSDTDSETDSGSSSTSSSSTASHTSLDSDDATEPE